MFGQLIEKRILTGEEVIKIIKVSSTFPEGFKTLHLNPEVLSAVGDALKLAEKIFSGFYNFS